MASYAQRIQRFARMQTQSRELNTVQDRIAQAHNPIVDQPFFSGALLTDIALSSSAANTIKHGLERKPLGFVVAGKSAAADVYEDTASRSDAVITLNASADVIVSLWVY